MWWLFFGVSLVVLSGCASAKPIERSDVRQIATAEAAGIKIERIHPSAGGQMLDLRYSVMDADKARLVINHQTRVYLIDQASGAKLPIPNMAKIGKLRQLPVVTEGDRIFWMFFSNPGAVVKPGAKVTLVIDEIRIKDIVVQ